VHNKVNRNCVIGIVYRLFKNQCNLLEAYRSLIACIRESDMCTCHVWINPVYWKLDLLMLFNLDYVNARRNSNQSRTMFMSFPPTDQPS